jgi:hypothetical protein
MTDPEAPLILTDLCRCFAVIAENKRKVAALVAGKP